MLIRRNHNQLCSGRKGIFGCKCGDTGNKTGNNILYGPIGGAMIGSNKNKDSGTAGIEAAGKSVKDATKMTDQEQSQYSNSFDIGKFLQEYFQGQMTGQQASGTISADQQYQNQGALEQGLYNQTVQDVNNPYGSYESALQPALQQAQDA